MIVTLSHRPSGFEGVVVSDPIYMQGHDAEGVYGYLLLNFKGDKCAVHLSVTRWGVGVLRALREDWKFVISVCRERGCKELIAINPAETEKWYKLIRHFGFTEFKTYRVYSQEV